MGGGAGAGASVWQPSIHPIIHYSGTALPAAEGSPVDSFLFIGELAKRTGLDPKTIRFYERAELLSPPRHGKFRTYLASDVRRLQNILTLRRLGVPIAQIRIMLEEAGDCDDILAAAIAGSQLRAHLMALKSKQAELVRQIEQTASVIERHVA